MAQEQGYPTGYEGYQGYGGYGQAMDPASMRAKLAMAMLQQGSDSSPIRSPWQGAARMSNALFGALMMRQMQDAQSSSWQKALAGMPTAAGGGLAPGGTPGGGSPGLPAQPGALSDLANDPDVLRGVANAGRNGLPDTATIGQSLQQGGRPPQVGPPMPAMAPNNAAGGMPPGYIGGGGGPGSMAPNMTASNEPRNTPPQENFPTVGPMFGEPSMFAQQGGRQPLDPRMMVAGPGAPSLPPSGPASGNGPQGAGAGFNPADLAMFQQDMQGVPGTPPGASGDMLQQLKANIARTESQGSGGYSAVGPVTNGDRAFGKYQVMGNNIPSWTQAALGQSMTPQEFLNNPQAQEAVVNHRLGGYLQQYGPAGAARAWFTGSPTGAGKDVNGMTGDRYAALATQGMGGAGAPPASGALAFNGGPPPASPAVAAIQGAAGPPGGPNGPPGSMQPNMMVAGPGVPSGARGGAPPPMPPPGALGPPPDAGGGGNPLSALGNMFGMANPSSPQGGSSPAPAGGGAGGQANDPRFKALTEVLADPYAAPGAKQVAMQFLQYYMPHPTTWETKPGTFDQAEKDWMGRFTGNERPGPHDLQPIDLGTDFNGQAQKGYVDRNTNQVFVYKDGQLVSLSPGKNGQQPAVGGAPPPPSPTGTNVTPIPPGAPNSVPPGNIPPPNPAWTPGVSSSPGIAGAVPSPADWTKGLDARQALIMQNPGQFSGSLARVPAAQLGDVMSEARAIVEGRQQPYGVTGVGPTKPYEQAVKDAVRAIDPAYTSTRYDSIKDFNGSTQGSTGGQLTQGRTGIGHLRQAMDLSQQLNQNQSGIGNMPVIGPIYNEMIGNQKQKDIAGAYTEAVTKANSELTRFYLGAPGSAGEREEGLRNELSASANPDVRTKALKELAELANSKIEKLQERWHAGTGGNMPDYPILQSADLDNFKYTQSFGRLADKGQSPAPNASVGAQPPGTEIWHQGGNANGPIEYRPKAGGAQAAPAPPPGVTHVWTPNGGLKPVSAQ
jgi:hypothetical protein